LKPCNIEVNGVAFRLALIGFGGVNQGLVELLRTHQKRLGSLRMAVTAIADLRLGTAYNPRGFEFDALLESGFSADVLHRIPHRPWDAASAS
jgi:homoserine dehydrogenase